MNEAEKLAELFERFPGIGPRQARRFVYFLLKSGVVYRNNLEQAIHNITKNIHECSQCYRYYSGENTKLCQLCATPSRNDTQLLIVEKDADLDQIEKSGAYSGRYYVLGTRIKLTDTDNNIPHKQRLMNRITQMSDLNEIILALPATTEGEHATQVIQHNLQNIAEERNIAITVLGRGLSTGTELEYADAHTLKNALDGRK